MKYAFFFLACFSFLSSFAQNNCPVKRGYAFYTVNMPGNIRVDENGNQVKPDPMIERVIYLECSGTTAPVLDSVLYKDSFIKGSLERVKGQSVNAGNKTSGNTPFRVTVRKGYTLWKLQLETLSQSSTAAINCPMITIRTRVKGKPCKFYLYRETELRGIPRY